MKSLMIRIGFAYHGERGERMTRQEAIDTLQFIRNNPQMADGVDKEVVQGAQEMFDMAIKALENIGHLKDRPCDVCEFHKENGCCKWACVFCDGLFRGME